MISGGFFFDKKQNKFVQSSSQVTNIFNNNPLIQQTLGYNDSLSSQKITYPFVKKLSVLQDEQIPTPEDLKNSYPSHNIQQISELSLDEKQVLKNNYFILVFIHSLLLSQFKLLLLALNHISTFFCSSMSANLKIINILDQSNPSGRCRIHPTKVLILFTQTCFKKWMKIVSTE
jgi:hypothetical protein